MATTPVQVLDGTLQFVEHEMLPALTGWKLIMASAALIQCKKNAEPLLQELADNKAVSMLGIVDGDGNIEVESAVTALKESIRKHGKGGKVPLDIPVLNISFSFTEANVDSLKDYIDKASE